jgi:sec-independent protein translocase protein TatA
MGRFGVTELLVILVIILVIFGPKQLPKLSKMLGQTITNFKKGVEDGIKTDEEDSAAKPTDEAAKKAGQDSSKSGTEPSGKK